MNYQDHKREYDQNGFVVVPNFVGANELAGLRSQIDRFLRDVVPTLPVDQIFYHTYPSGMKALRLVHRMNCDPFFEEYRNRSQWHELARALVGEPVRANSPKWLNKPAGSDHVTPPHQDNRYYNLTAPNAVTIFLALEAIDDENGCVRYLAGSHKKGPCKHIFSGVGGFSQQLAHSLASDSAPDVAVHLQPGDACCHHPETIHWACSNRSLARSRQAFGIVFEAERCLVDEAARERYEQDARRGGMTF